MAKSRPKPSPRPAPRPAAAAGDDEFRPRRTSWVTRVGIAILGLAVVISSLVPLLSLFQR